MNKAGSIKMVSRIVLFSTHGPRSDFTQDRTKHFDEATFLQMSLVSHQPHLDENGHQKKDMDKSFNWYFASSCWINSLITRTSISSFSSRFSRLCGFRCGSPDGCRLRVGGLHADGSPARPVRQIRSSGSHARTLGATLRSGGTHSSLRILCLQRH